MQFHYNISYKYSSATLVLLDFVFHVLSAAVVILEVALYIIHCKSGVTKLLRPYYVRVILLNWSLDVRIYSTLIVDQPMFTFT